MRKCPSSVARVCVSVSVSVCAYVLYAYVHVSVRGVSDHVLHVHVLVMPVAVLRDDSMASTQ